MKFSVLLPTRNRLTYLQHAVESVRRQDYTNWEVVISDNFSDDDIEGYVRELRDVRVRYKRTQRFEPVTENWNLALEGSSGDYVVMLGDDDALAPRYFSTLLPLIEQFNRPDLLYTSAYLYMQPGVTRSHPGGFLQPYGYAAFLRGAKGPFILARSEARDMVKAFANFRVTYGFNMQFALIARPMIDAMKMRGSFFQSPFPDYYAMNAMFLSAERIAVTPKPLVVIGVTPKSYGFFHINARESEGIAFLQGRAKLESSHRLARPLIPGSNLNTCWLLSLEALNSAFRGEHIPTINYRRYRLLQIFYVYENHYITGEATEAHLRALQSVMKWHERMLCAVIVAAVLAAERLTRRAVRRRVAAYIRNWVRQTPHWDARPLEGAHHHMGDVFDYLERNNATERGISTA